MKGFTLIECMVALTLSLLMSFACMQCYFVIDRAVIFQQEVADIRHRALLASHYLSTQQTSQFFTAKASYKEYGRPVDALFMREGSARRQELVAGISGLHITRFPRGKRFAFTVQSRDGVLQKNWVGFVADSEVDA